MSCVAAHLSQQQQSPTRTADTIAAPQQPLSSPQPVRPHISVTQDLNYVVCCSAPVSEAAEPHAYSGYHSSLPAAARLPTARQGRVRAASRTSVQASWGHTGSGGRQQTSCTACSRWASLAPLLLLLPDARIQPTHLALQSASQPLQRQCKPC